MNKLLVVVDMQNDFIDGVLGSRRAQAIVEKVCKKIDDWNGLILATMDKHDEETYGKTVEGSKLPKHCIYGTEGWMLRPVVHDALASHNGSYIFDKVNSFGFADLSAFVARHQIDSVQFVGLCTDVCVITTALMLRAFNPWIDISVDSSCCAGVTKEGHESALQVMKECCIDIL